MSLYICTKSNKGTPTLAHGDDVRQRHQAQAGDILLLVKKETTSHGAADEPLFINLTSGEKGVLIHCDFGDDIMQKYLEKLE